MRVILTTCFFCLICVVCQSQNIQYKVGLHTTYMPKFTVQEASDKNVQVTGLRLSFSDYKYLPFELGLHVYGGYGETARASFGLNLAWLITGPKSQFKAGLSLSKIDLEDVEVNENEFGPHVGDVSFADFGTEFKPYIEFEWGYSRFSSLFIQTGYRIINGEKSVVTGVEGSGLDRRVTERDDSFFYSASGFEVGLGISINF